MVCEIVAIVMATRLYFNDAANLAIYFDQLISLLNMRFAFQNLFALDQMNPKKTNPKKTKLKRN